MRAGVVKRTLGRNDESSFAHVQSRKMSKCPRAIEQPRRHDDVKSILIKHGPLRTTYTSKSEAE